jgi:hypothetical protein
MLFDFLKKKRQEKADDQQHWRERWQSLVPEENRSVPVTVDGQTRIAYIQINQFVVMLQDGLLMKAHFFDVCEFFQKAGYHVIWLMRCVQDVEGGYLKLVRMEDGGARCRWKWRKPTTNFGRWTSDNRCVTILLQYKLLCACLAGILRPVRLPMIKDVVLPVQLQDRSMCISCKIRRRPGNCMSGQADVAVAHQDAAETKASVREI